MNGPAVRLRRDISLGVKNLLLHKLRSLLKNLKLLFFSAW